MNSLQKIHRQLDSYSTLSPGWDSYDSFPISHRAIETTRTVLQYLAQNINPLLWAWIDVNPAHDGGVDIEGRKGRKEFEVGITPKGETEPTVLLITTNSSNAGQEYQSEYVRFEMSQLPSIIERHLMSNAE